MRLHLSWNKKVGRKYPPEKPVAGNGLERTRADRRLPFASLPQNGLFSCYLQSNLFIWALWNKKVLLGVLSHFLNWAFCHIMVAFDLFKPTYFSLPYRESTFLALWEYRFFIFYHQCRIKNKKAKKFSLNLWKPITSEKLVECNRKIPN